MALIAPNPLHACVSAFDGKDRYQIIQAEGAHPTQNIHEFQPAQHIVAERNKQGDAVAGRIRALVDNKNSEVYIIGPFNNWGKDKTEADRLHPESEDGVYFTGHIRDLQHGMEYRLEVNGQQVIDPAANYFTAEGPLNSIFWDFNHPGHYQMQQQPVDLRGRPVAIAETDIHGLVQYWPRKNGELGPENLSETYRFIAESGVIQQLKRMNYNAIEFLPFHQSGDPNAWQYRYQAFGLFAVDSRYGTPEDFMRMVDAFHKEDIAVIADVVVGHYPRGGNSGSRDLQKHGLGPWQKSNGDALYGASGTEWGTNRYDYENPFIRKFLSDSILSLVKNFRLAGFRFDNVDGMSQQGAGAQQFLKEVNAELRTYAPWVFSNAEAFVPPTGLLYGRADNGYGFSTMNQSNFFNFFAANAQQRTEHLNLWEFLDAAQKPIGWEQAAGVYYTTNHDEAAQGNGGTRGSFPANSLGSDPYYVYNKTKAFNTLAMLASPAAYMDMPHLRLLQRGNFGENPGIDWRLLNDPNVAKVNDYFSAMSGLYTNGSEFAFRNFHTKIVKTIDHDNKVVVVERYDFETNKILYAVINLGHKAIDNYRIGVSSKKEYRIVLDSDRTQFLGSGKFESTGKTSLKSEDHHMHDSPQSVNIDHLGPYSALVFEGLLH